MQLLDMKVFVDTDSDIRLARRLQRDISHRGRDLEGVLKQYNSFVKPSFDHYIAPLMAHADIIVPRGGANEVAISLIVQHVQTQLQLVIHRQIYAVKHKGYVTVSLTERLQTKTNFSECSNQSTAAQYAPHLAVDAASEGLAHVHS